jgi:hypothetical protein
MSALAKSLLLFFLNLLDAQLTLIWVRFGFATEGNGLMAALLEMGNGPFLLVKLLTGAFSAYVLYRWSHLPLARRGMMLALSIYLALMCVHAATGINALGWQAPPPILSLLARLDAFFAFCF